MKAPPGVQTRQQSHSFERKVTTALAANYLLFLPEGYAAEKTKRWPLILFLHGSGERGSSVWSVAKHGPPKIVKKRPEFPFIVVSPQCPKGRVWSTPVLLALLDEILANYRIDKRRVYLTGMSMGGYGTWNLALARPERFAAIAPVCGGGDPLPFVLGDRAQAKALKSLPIWAFHGAKDTTVKPEESERMVKAARDFGCDARLTVHPDAGHDSWTETYQNPRLYEWFLEHRR